MYPMTCTCTEVGSIEGQLLHYLENTTKPLWIAVKLIYCYITGTLCTGSVDASVGDEPVPISGSSDSDWARGRIDRQPTTGLCVWLQGERQRHHENRRISQSVSLLQLVMRIGEWTLLHKNVFGLSASLALHWQR